jgi:4-aminobutyrate aminotransferase-like enzyme/aminoglycoside phosphotransferase (APT) family kinase protein
MESDGVLHASPPAFSLDQAAELARRHFGMEANASPLVSERDQNVLLQGRDEPWVLKISNAAERREVVEMEVAAVAHVAGVDPSLPVPLARTSAAGETVVEVPGEGAATHLLRLLPRLPGRSLLPQQLDAAAQRHVGETVARLALALRGFFHPAAGRSIEWDQQHLLVMAPHARLVADPERRALLERAVERFREHVAPVLPRLRAQVIHNDVTLDNLLFDESRRISGIIDFGDMAHTALVLDVPATLQSLIRGRDDLFEVAAEFLAGYASVLPLERAEADLLGELLAGRMVQTILISVFRTRQFPDNEYIRGWEEPAWELLAGLEAVGIDVANRRLSVAARTPPRRRVREPVAEGELIARRRVLGSALEALTYRRPLHLVSGSGAWVYDAAGRGYLDAYNNVPVVGHAHPVVADAIARQAGLLNTNTRYLHDAILELAERLVASMPPGLDTVMFVNSGSEANDLAWRLATTVTGADAGLVTEWAYHGVTAAIADFSPSEWPGGKRPDGVETFAAPDTYRGPYLTAEDAVAVARSQMSAALGRLAERGRRPAALFIDSMFTADGIFAPAAELVAALVGEARAAGALFVADEVQAGHGRGGAGLWTFPAWGVTPDIVTMGKPMGNGHPIAAVMTRAELVDRMAAETTFFSTFGGNPVACVAALAVLDVIDDEGLVGRAEIIGEGLRSRLKSLAQRRPVIGDVRGRGLMTGVELVDPATGDPAPGLAAAVRDEMRERGVLIGTTRREKNVLKVRPPLCVTPSEAELIATTLDEVLGA